MARVAVVTGGTRGIGAAISKALKAAGYKVAASYAGNDEAANKFKAETGINVYKWDVSNYDACVAGLKQIEADLGPVEVLVNNAGITSDAPFHRMTPDQWYAVINTNLNSLFNMSRPVWDGMRSRKFGRIINISSINGQKGQFGQANYSASKAGDIGFTKALALEGARAGITVNAICPGYIATEMVMAVPKDVLEKNILPQIPVGRLGEPEEIARAWCSSPPTMPASSPARRCRRTAGNTWCRLPRLRSTSMDLGLTADQKALQARAREFVNTGRTSARRRDRRDRAVPLGHREGAHGCALRRDDDPRKPRRAGALLPRCRARHRGDGEVLHRHGANRGRDQHGRNLDRDGLRHRGAEELAAALVLSGDKPAICITEPEAGSDATAMTTRADRKGDRYVINGRKHWITGGGVSRLHLIFARVFDERGADLGIGGFLAMRDEAKGLRIVRREKTMGLRGMPEGELAFENLEIPAGMALIPPSGFRRGFADLMTAYNSQRVGAGTVGMGIAAGALELATRLGQAARAVRPPDRRIPGLAMDAGRHADAAHRVAADALSGGALARGGVGLSRPDARRAGEDFRLRSRDPHRQRCVADVRRARLFARSSAWNEWRATCACSPSAAAPRRCCARWSPRACSAGSCRRRATAMSRTRRGRSPPSDRRQAGLRPCARIAAIGTARRSPRR